MEGVVDNIIRDLFTQIGGYDHCVTEFIRVTRHLLSPKVFYRFCPELHHGGRTPSGIPVYIQLLGGDPSVIADNAAVAERLGALGIDLNFGCPAKTVNQHDGGAALLKNPHRLFDIITAVRKSVHLPVTAKVRLGFEDKSLSLEIAQAVDEAQAHQLTIHARTKLEGYRPPAHWEYIAQMKEVVQLPVVANGDIWTLQDYIRCRKITGCRDIALGRAAMANPYLAQEIKSFLAKNDGKNWSSIPDSELIEPTKLSGNGSGRHSQNQDQDQDQDQDLREPHLYFKKLLEIWFPLFIQKCCQQKGDFYALTRLKQWFQFLKRDNTEALQLFESIKKQKSLPETLLILAQASHKSPIVTTSTLSP